jgi:phage-related protein, tail component
MNIHGSKKGSSKPRQPIIAPDSAQSKTYINILYGLCEGQIAGLADGGKSIRLDGTPIIGENQQINLAGIEWDFRAGSIDQTPISGFAMVKNEMAVGVELRSDKPFVRTINNRELSAVRVRLNFNALKQHHEKATLQDMPSAMPLTYKPMAVHSNKC